VIDKRILGAIPSTLYATHPEAFPILRAGYQVTDFASLFGAPKDGFFVTTARENPIVIRDIVVESLGPLALSSGDALLFDHFFLHRTGVAPGMTRERHAIETWFFAPSTYPDGQIPLVY